MTVCGRCGSMQLIKGQPGLVDGVVSYFTGRNPFVCKRCGWRGRREWSDRDLADARLRLQTNEAEIDPSLAVLDRQAKKRKRKTTDERSDARRFDLGFHDLGTLTEAGDPTPISLPETKSRPTTRRLKARRTSRTRRREIVSTIVVTCGVLLFVALMSVLGSCQPNPAP